MLKCVHSVPAFGSLNGPTERLGSWCQTNPKLQRASKRASFWFLKKAITCSHLLMQPLAATCCSHLSYNHLQIGSLAASGCLGKWLPLPACPSSHLQRPLAATCSDLQPLAATSPSSHLQLQAATCNHLPKQPLAVTCSHSHRLHFWKSNCAPPAPTMQNWFVGCRFFREACLPDYWVKVIWKKHCMQH